ncbi:hypothetical protein DJ39_787 [Yersinia ruckeri ATCC 29473]|uniref:Uncharacterized protein n=1 Tax=Yersinia ruckeri TaxID=29486 RepID=A0A0A8VB84_YERRU|nr:hypothetical protein yruck0001_20830 [Yersinia ruckeri ATCC 29473]QTD75903.1 Uncharacterized protein YR821_0972 [Yersinia ruckeri]KGA49403.1 hypothetical protein DJ39_787 [Yersinia ruckeri ATCC 29473]CEK26800.1 hypothetical protein CSF007_5165 [Yersinia ruckeri]CNI17914.1 Uncharacterised protein [Yersinia ruckeri]
MLLLLMISIPSINYIPKVFFNVPCNILGDKINMISFILFTP